MGKLHEILAVEDSLQKIYHHMCDEAKTTFTKRHPLFEGVINRQEPRESDIGGASNVRAETESHLVVETVEGKLKWLKQHAARYFDAVAQKEITNTVAKADLTISGIPILSNAPATLLLGFENRLKKLRDVFFAIPTSDGSKQWKPTEWPGVRQTEEEHRNLTMKKERCEKVFEPTEHQPGQFRTYTEDVHVGDKFVTKLNGMSSVEDKAALLGRLDGLILACKQARQRANDHEVEKTDAGDAIMNYLLGS